MAFRVAVFSLLSVFLSSCVPGFLSKYRNGRENSEVQSGAATSARADTKKTGSSTTPISPLAARPKHPVIFALDQGTFRFQLGFDRVWDASLDVLLRNYNLAIADRSNGLITTEWDSYYLDGKVHRNKLSMRLKRMSGNLVEMTIFNNVEVLSKLPDGGITEIWLPTDKNKVEIGRIVQNMALAMGQPKPDLPQDLMLGANATGEKSRL